MRYRFIIQKIELFLLVMILHSFNVNKEMYLLTELSAQLNKRGIAVLFDFNGHGDSKGSFMNSINC